MHISSISTARRLLRFQPGVSQPDLDTDGEQVTGGPIQMRAEIPLDAEILLSERALDTKPREVNRGASVNRRTDPGSRGKAVAPQVGLEPTTLRLTAECSTIELLRIGGRDKERVSPRGAASPPWVADRKAPSGSRQAGAGGRPGRPEA